MTPLHRELGVLLSSCMHNRPQVGSSFLVTVKFGVVFPHNEIGTDSEAIKSYAVGVDRDLKADHMLIYDHVLGVDPNLHHGWSGLYDKDVAFHEPFTVFAFMAAVTETVEFATSVLVLPQRQTALVAKQAAELAILSNYRLRMGIGTGWNEVEYEALDVPFEHRGSRQAEQVELMRKLWTDDSLLYEGRFHTVSHASILPRPERAIPIWFGGIAPPLLRRCALLGDGWFPLGTPNEQSARAIETMRKVREEHGLSWKEFGIQAQAQYRGGTPERWKRHARRWADLGCTHLAIATHNAGNTTVEQHLEAARRYLDAVR